MADYEVHPTVVDELGPRSVKQTDSSEACLIVLYGTELGHRIPLPQDEPFVIGRDVDCNLMLDDETVSRRHARLQLMDSCYEIADLGSTNGTYLNEGLNAESSLRDGDTVQIGRTIFKFLQGGEFEANFHQVIYSLMTTDGLTSTYNRRYFEDQLKRETSRAARYERALALMILDIDHFKKVNDTRGHLGGDAVLRQLAKILRHDIRREDILCRVGGEEFAVLLPEGTLAGVGILAERLRVSIEQYAFSFEEQEFQVTCSFGVAAANPTRDARPEDLYERADQALYEAKNGGRNRVVAH